MYIYVLCTYWLYIVDRYCYDVTTLCHCYAVMYFMVINVPDRTASKLVTSEPNLNKIGLMAAMAPTFPCNYFQVLNTVLSSYIHEYGNYVSSHLLLGTTHRFFFSDLPKFLTSDISFLNSSVDNITLEVITSSSIAYLQTNQL